MECAVCPDLCEQTLATLSIKYIKIGDLLYYFYKASLLLIF